MNGEGFRTKLQALINEHSMECGSNTPDFILAKYLAKCLTNFDESVVARDTWYGKRATGTAMVDFERTPPESRSINPTPESRTEGMLEAPAWLFKSKGMLEAPAWLLKSAIGFLLSLQTSGDVHADDEMQHRLVAARSLEADPADFIEWASERDRVFTRWRIEHGVEAGDVAASKRAFDALAKKLEPGDVAAAKGALDALSAARSTAFALGDGNIVAPLRVDEERDWRTFAFAKTGEGSVWERTAVQRLFATIDHHRSKWQEYENEYILPCFQWARELGIDLEWMVRDKPGHNCVELLVSTLRKRIAFDPGAVDSARLPATRLPGWYWIRQGNALFNLERLQVAYWSADGGGLDAMARWITPNLLVSFSDENLNVEVLSGPLPTPDGVPVHTLTELREKGLR
jgi:hypothetical protein